MQRCHIFLMTVMNLLVAKVSTASMGNSEHINTNTLDHDSASMSVSSNAGAPDVTYISDSNLLRQDALHNAYISLDDLIPRKQYRPNMRLPDETDAQYSGRYQIGLSRFQKDQKKLKEGVEKVILANQDVNKLREEVAAYIKETQMRHHERHMATIDELAHMGYTKEAFRQLAPDDPIREQILNQVKEMRRPKYKAIRYRTAYRRAENEEERAFVLSRAIKAGLPMHIITRPKHSRWLTHPHLDMNPLQADDHQLDYLEDPKEEEEGEVDEDEIENQTLQPTIEGVSADWLSLSLPGQDISLPRDIQRRESSMHEVHREQYRKRLGRFLAQSQHDPL